MANREVVSYGLLGAIAYHGAYDRVELPKIDEHLPILARRGNVGFEEPHGEDEALPQMLDPD